MVDVGAARLWSWDTGGSGRPVILLHAGTQSGCRLGLPAAGPGAGRLPRDRLFAARLLPLGAGDPANPGFAADDLDRLIRHLALDTVDLVGAAQGAFFVVDYALAWPDKVRSLAIVSSYLGITDCDYGSRQRAPAASVLRHAAARLPGTLAVLPRRQSGRARGVE